jgi:hypothetical protein
LTHSFFPAYKTGGKHEGELPVCVWQVIEIHPDSVKNTFDYLNHIGRCPHLVWDPVSGDVIQGLPPYVAGSLFSQEINRAGKPLIEVAVLGHRGDPFTDGPMKGYRWLFKALESWGVPQVWPKGPPPFAAHSVNVFKGISAAGHYSIDQLDSAFLGTGPIDIGRMMREPLPVEVDVPDGDFEIPQDWDWYPDEVDDDISV